MRIDIYGSGDTAKPPGASAKSRGWCCASYSDDLSKGDKSPFKIGMKHGLFPELGLELTTELRQGYAA